MRTHMNAIVAFSFLMKDNGCNDSEREEFSNQILSSCEQLIGLFDSFLDSCAFHSKDASLFKEGYWVFSYTIARRAEIQVGGPASSGKYSAASRPRRVNRATRPSRTWACTR